MRGEMMEHDVAVSNDEVSAAPQGWATVAMPDVVELNPGKPPADGLPADALVSFVPMAAVDDQTGAITGAATRRFGQVRKGYTAFRDGDVIMAKITPCMENGKAAVAHGLTNGLGFGSTEFHVFRSHGAVLPEYIYHYVRRESFRRSAAAQMTGSVGQKRVPRTFLEEVEFNLPPLAEQLRIVAEIEAIFEMLTSCRERLERVPAILRRFRQSVLAAACSGRLTEDWRVRNSSIPPMAVRLHENRSLPARPRSRRTRHVVPPVPDANSLPEIPNTWAWAWLPDLGELNRGKSRHRPRNDPRLYGGPFPFVQTGDIARSGGRVVSHSQTYNQAGLAQSRLWPAGTVCITIAANIAESAILTYPACFPDSVVGLLADPETCLPEYVEFFVRTARSDLAQYAPATAQSNINLEILRQVAVPLPPVEEQREIVGRVGTLLDCASVAEQRALASGVCVAKLTESVLAKAFRGELVPAEAELAAAEGRPFESAEDLLARVVAARSPGKARRRERKS